MNRWLSAARAALLLVLAAAAPAAAQRMAPPPPEALEGVGIEERLGGVVPGELVFRDERGGAVALRDVLDRGRPVLLSFVYHDCPMLCSVVLDGLTAALRELEWTPGGEFELLTVSFSPADTPEAAARQKARYLKALGRPEAAAGWHFLTGEAEAVARLTDAAGFRYRWDAAQQQYAHTAALVFLSPEGKITRYLYGIEYDPFDVRTALVEAGQGRVGTIKDRVIMFCYQYDPDANSYVPHAVNLMKLGGLATFAGLGSLLLVFWRRERSRQRESGLRDRRAEEEEPIPPS